LQSLNWLRRAAYGGVAAITATVGLAGLTATAAHATVTTNTIAGPNRYDTSAAVAETKYPSGVPSGTVILATGLNYPDALAGNYLAGQDTSPVLLTTATASDPAFSATVKPALAKLLPGSTKNVVILGGTSAVGADVQTALTSAGYTVTRIGGATRYDTAQMVDTQTGKTPGNGTSGQVTCLVATGQNFADALAAGPLAWNKHFPIVLTDGTQSTLSSQATATISADGCKHFLIMGGSAAISSGISTQLASLGTVDKQFAGVDRYDTAAQIASYEVANYGFNASKLFLVSGVNFPDALSAGPLAGDPGPLVEDNGTTVTSGPATNECAAAGSNAVITQVGGNAANGSGSLSACQTAATNGSPNAFTVTGPTPSATPTVSTAGSPSQGATTYTVSGLPATGTVNIALFPCTGPTAPTTSSNGTSSFASTNGAGTAGNANGEGATSNNAGGNLNGGANAGFATGSFADAPPDSSAAIVSVNGVPTTATATHSPTVVYGVSPNSGSVTFVVNSDLPDCGVPVVYSAPTSAGGAPPLAVASNGTPASGYSVGTGTLTFWSAAAAPAGNYSNYMVVLANASNNTFQACQYNAAVTTFTNCFTFTYGQTGSSYSYDETPGVSGTTNPLPLSQAAFSGDLSTVTGPTAATSTAPATVGAAGDTLNIAYGGATSPGTFAYDGVFKQGGEAFGDVPAAPTAVTTTFQAAVTTGPLANQHPAGVLVSWTAPGNSDVFAYQVQRAVVSSAGVTGAFGPAGNGFAVSGAGAYTANNNGGYVLGTQTPSGVVTAAPGVNFFDPNAAAGTKVVYRVIAYGDGNNGNLSGPLVGIPCALAGDCDNTSTSVGANSPSTANSAPVTVTASAAPSVTGPLSTSTSSASPGANLANGDSIDVNFNTAVTVASSWSLEVVDTAGNEALLNSADSSASVANSGLTLIITVGVTGGPAAPTKVSGATEPAKASGPWEMLSAGGITGTGTGTPAWNVEASGAKTGSVNEAGVAVGVTREIVPAGSSPAGAASNAGLPVPPLVTINGASSTTGTANTITATCNVITDSLNFYDATGTLLGSVACTSIASASYAAPSGVTFTSGNTYIVGESPVAAPVYNNAAHPGQESQTVPTLAT
jgi:putative cell wall-binding protein